MPAAATAFVAAIGLFASVADALGSGATGRREILQQGGAAFAVVSVEPTPGASNSLPREEGDGDGDNLRNIFRSLSSPKQQTPQSIDWSPPSKDFSQLRYSTSSLSTKEIVVPDSNCESLPRLPSWMEGHWVVTYKFEGVSFPNGRDRLSLALPGAGLGTCAALPNVGANTSPFVQRFGSTAIPSEDARAAPEAFVAEDVAYNLPRRFESFWPAAKVSSVQVRTSSTTSDLGPACLVTGEGCSPEENPRLHGRRATRCRMEFLGPTRRGGPRTQHLDVSMVDCSTSSSSHGGDDDEFLMARSFVQYNQEQELTGYYREYVSYDRRKSERFDGELRGQTCVAAFLPPSQETVVVYRYSMTMRAVTEDEATMY